jgi:flavin reductase (DIM6/NTAB) family NADH-FMN oxidoreductase RutF
MANKKVIWKPGNLVYPIPAVMVSCGSVEEKTANIITIAWTGTICTDPAMCFISVRPSRHSYKLIKDQGDFVINLTTRRLAEVTDWCGVRSGKDYDKFKESGLTPVLASSVRSPVIAECPINIECKVTQVISLGSHDMFLARVESVQADSRYIDEKGGFDMAAADLVAYSNGKYCGLTKPFGKFGYSIQKKKGSRKNRL